VTPYKDEYQKSVMLKFDYMHTGGEDKTLKLATVTSVGPLRP